MLNRDEVARQVAKRFGLSNPDLWIAGHNRWETKLWDALIDSELRHEADQKRIKELESDVRRWKDASDANRDSAMGYQDRALGAERRESKAELRIQELREALRELPKQVAKEVGGQFWETHMLNTGLLKFIKRSEALLSEEKRS